jgi:hypothetical protein
MAQCADHFGLNQSYDQIQKKALRATFDEVLPVYDVRWLYDHYSELKVRLGEIAQ